MRRKKGPDKDNTLEASEDTEREAALRTEANRLMEQGDTKRAMELFSEARKLRSGATKAPWSNKFAGFRHRAFETLLTDNERDYGVTGVTTGMIQTLKNGKVVCREAGLRFGVTLLSTEDERIPPEVRKYVREKGQGDYLGSSDLLIDTPGKPILPRRKKVIKRRAQELYKELKRVAETESGSPHLGMTFLAKLKKREPFPPKDFWVSLDIDPSSENPPSGYIDTRRLLEEDVANLTRTEIELVLRAVRSSFAYDQNVHRVGSVRGGEHRRKK